MPNLTSVGITSGVPTSGTGTVSTSDALMADGGQTTIGAVADSAVTAGATGSLSAKLRSISRDIVSNIVLAAGSALIGIVKVGDGTNSAAIKAASTAPAVTDPALVVAISPNSVNANGQATMANSAPVAIASNQSAVPVSNTLLTNAGTGFYVAGSASSSPTFQSSTGATGDYLEGVLVIPATTAAGAVTIYDNATAIMSYPGGGTTALLTLTPFYIPMSAVSRSGAWKASIGANVSILAIGKFS